MAEFLGPQLQGGVAVHKALHFYEIEVVMFRVSEDESIGKDIRVILTQLNIPTITSMKGNKSLISSWDRSSEKSNLLGFMKI